MPRKNLYPEGGTSMHAWVPTSLKEGLEQAASDQRQSVSQLVTIVLEDYLRRRGYLREQEKAAV